MSGGERESAIGSLGLWVRVSLLCPFAADFSHFLVTLAFCQHRESARRVTFLDIYRETLYGCLLNIINAC